MSFVGDSGALRNAINAQHQQSAGQSDYPDQAHHLLSSNVLLKLEAKYAKLAEKATYDLNRGSNGLLMPTLYGHQKHPNLQRHRGGHRQELYAKVFDLVEPVYELYKGKNPCEDEEAKKNILDDLTASENDARDAIKNLDWELYSNSKNLYVADYRDEGVGDLSLDRPAFTAKADGERWLIDKAVGIKRRYELVNGTEVVRKDFYTRNGYPDPGSDPRS
jgi:hypothetical protein